MRVHERILPSDPVCNFSGRPEWLESLFLSSRSRSSSCPRKPCTIFFRVQGSSFLLTCLNTENAPVGFNERFLDNAATTPWTSGRLGEEVIGSRAVASGDFVQDPIKRQLGIRVACFARRDHLLRATDRNGAERDDVDIHISTD